MSSKMLAGVIAGGFGTALSIALDLSAHLFPMFALLLAIILPLLLGVLAGSLAARWLDLDDYGHQSSVGAFAGLVAVGLAEVADLILRLVFDAINKASPTSALSSFVLRLLPTPSSASFLLLLVVVNLLLYLVYLLVVVSVSSTAATLVGREKTAEALRAILGDQEPELAPVVDPSEMDPALLPFMRPEYSPFVAEEPPPQSPLRQGRLKQDMFVDRNRLPPERGGMPAPRRSQPGGLNQPGAPNRGGAPGAVPPRPVSHQRPPPDRQWPRPRGKD